MFGVLKKLFGKSGGHAEPPVQRPVAEPKLRVLPRPNPGSAGKGSPAAAPGRATSFTTRAAAAAAAKAKAAEAAAVGDDVVSVPYAAIIKLVPQELWGKTAPAGCVNVCFKLQKSDALTQLAHGAVKVPFGALRSEAPPGIFVLSSTQDERLIDLPLAEILPQLTPTDIARRPNQKQIQAPKEVGDLFGANTLSKPSITAPAGAARAPTPAPRPAAPPTASAPAPAPAAAPSAARPTAAPAPGNNFSPATSVVSQPAVPKAAPPSVAPALPSNTVPFPSAASARTAPAAKPAPSAADQPEVVTSTFEVGLADLADGWPDEIRQEIAQLQSPNPKCALPLGEVGEALKRGQVQYTWGQLRSWLVLESGQKRSRSPFEELVLDLPTRVLTPLYLDKTHGTAFFKKSSYADTKPDAFVREPREVTPPAPSAPAAPVAGAAAVASQPTQQPIAPGRLPTLAELKASVSSPATPAASRPIPARVAAPTTKPALPAAAALPRPATGGTAHLVKRVQPLAAKAATAPAPIPPAPASSKPPGANTLSLPFTTAVKQVPPELVEEIARLNLATAEIELPLNRIEADLKRGRLVYPWKEILEWLNLEVGSSSPNAEVQVELVLSAIAPLFFRRNPSAVPKKSNATLDIPDLFHDKDAEAKDVLAPDAPESTPAVALSQPAPLLPAAPAPAPATPAKVVTTMGELFGQPEKQSWNPNEIVEGCARIPGVSGALISLQEGLAVASSLPASWNSDALAAFLPQIFSRTQHCCREAQLGDARTVTVVVDRGTLVIYGAGLVHLAVVLEPGAAPPLTELNIVATELSRHTR